MVETEDHTTQKLLGVYKAISSVQMALAKLGIEKVQENKFDKYKFRGIDDIYNALSPFPNVSKHAMIIRLQDLGLLVNKTKK